MPKASALIVDDNATNISVLAQFLVLEDISVMSEMEPKAIIHDLSQFEGIDVIFLDLEMSVSGFEILRMVKEAPGFKDVPVIAYSIHTQHINLARDLGFDGFIGKPINADRFPVQIKAILRGEKVWFIP